MFRIALMFVAAFTLTPVAGAENGPGDAAGGSPLSESGNAALEIMRDHMRSQMDWRSYFTNRMEVRRRAGRSGGKPRGDLSAATVEPPR